MRRVVRHVLAVLLLLLPLAVAGGWLVSRWFRWEVDYFMGHGRLLQLRTEGGRIFFVLWYHDGERAGGEGLEFYGGMQDPHEPPPKVGPLRFTYEHDAFPPQTVEMPNGSRYTFSRGGACL